MSAIDPNTGTTAATGDLATLLQNLTTAQSDNLIIQAESAKFVREQTAQTTMLEMLQTGFSASLNQIRKLAQSI